MFKAPKAFGVFQRVLVTLWSLKLALWHSQVPEDEPESVEPAWQLNPAGKGANPCSAGRGAVEAECLPAVQAIAAQLGETPKRTPNPRNPRCSDAIEGCWLFTSTVDDGDLKAGDTVYQADKVLTTPAFMHLGWEKRVRD